MNNLAKLKEQASQYNLASLKKVVSEDNLIGGGMEGKIYRLTEDLVVKFRRGIGAGYNQREDNLAEHQRQAVHDTVNSLANGRLEWQITNRVTHDKQMLSSKLIDILSVYVDGKHSASIMQFIKGRTLEYSSTILGMFDAYKKCGVIGDFHGENVMRDWASGVDYLVLETWGNLNPDVFKSIERINPKNKDQVMGNLARAHLFGGTSPYPTAHEEMAAGSGMCFYHPITWHDIALVSKANDHKEITYENLKNCLHTAREKLTATEGQELSECGVGNYEWEVMGIEAIGEARRLFGPQFIPVRFDWENGSNLDIYGINPTLYNDFRLAVDKIRPELQPTIDSAKKLMENLT